MSPYAQQLADAVDPVVAPWVRGAIVRLLAAAGISETPELRRRIDDAAGSASSAVSRELRAFLALDVDEQRTNPLAVLRSAVRFPTEVLRRAGVPGCAETSSRSGRSPTTCTG